MEIEQAIEKKRKKMIYMAEMYGFTSPRTIKCSEELDNLLNIHRKLIQNRRPIKRNYQ